MPVIGSVLDTLISLALGRNDISSIPDNYFANFVVLSRLYIGQTLITSINTSTFSGLTELKVLVMKSSTLLTTVAPDAFNGVGTTALRTFNMAGTSLTEFPCLGPSRATQPPRSEIVVILNDTLISVIRKECVDGLTNLGSTVFHLSNTPISSLVNLSTAMIDIRELYISSNPALSDFPVVDTGQIANTKLELLWMGLTNYPLFPMIQSRQKLHTIYAPNSNIDCLPSTRISSMSSLVFLDLSNNKLSQFPDDSCHNVASDSTLLTSYGISQNLNFVSLIYINLAHNDLETFPALSTAVNIEDLLLGQNKISYVFWSDVSSFTSLQVLDINGNGMLAFLPDLPVSTDMSLSSLGTLTYLDLSENSLRGVASKFSSMTSMDLYVDTNPLVCDWRHCWMKTWAQATTHLHIGIHTCAEPAALATRDWGTLTTTDLGCNLPDGGYDFSRL